jgi:hypothetical protein
MGLRNVIESGSKGRIVPVHVGVWALSKYIFSARVRNCGARVIEFGCGQEGVLAATVAETGDITCYQSNTSGLRQSIRPKVNAKPN